ncbi:WAT1-related protein At3g02690, chloroplastic [Aristolochia californica]|uniref:WAT1-related protein At3g02690, chloroplastic n=1 Tax=Aristolochia californica TaxID=171875 RepID=UPI0035E2A199
MAVEMAMSMVSSSSFVLHSANIANFFLCQSHPPRHIKTAQSSKILLRTGLSPRISVPHRQGCGHGSPLFLPFYPSTKFNNPHTTVKGLPRVRCQNQRRPSDRAEMVDCVGTGTDVECVAVSASSSKEEDGDASPLLDTNAQASAPVSNPQTRRLLPLELQLDLDETQKSSFYQLWESLLLISPFFFWGTAMVAMKEVLPKAGPFFVSAFRLIPAGALLVSFATLTGRKQPSGFAAWLSILLFGAVDATCFQGFLAEGLQKTSAGLGSVIIDSQPLTVAILAALLFGESIGVVGAAGLVVGVVGLLLLEVPSLSFEAGSTIWGSGEWWMLLAAQSMAVGTVMVRWVTKYSDPVMATGWHMVIGGLPLLAISVLNHDPAIAGDIKDLTSNDLLALFYTSLFGSAISYGVYFYNATRGSLTKLSSLTFLTPMFASIFGYLYLGETFSSVQLIGAAVTVLAIYMVNYRVMVPRNDK